MPGADALGAREARAVLEHELRRVDLLRRHPLLDGARGFLGTRRRAAALRTQSKEELARHHVVRELVDVTHDVAERLGLVHVQEPRAGRHDTVAHAA